MGSLNGDIMVMRNGRSTSQVSVYNYPEHLNPFYEDDQHKRLRFWKINKKDNEGRRNSFSIGNLKDMWTFKSFRMKKKSSTLGINKTSESPPLLRREYALDNGWNTFDHRLRASNTPSINGDSFQRNAIYRSSLQTLPTSNDRMGLNRNDGYRSTIQVPRSYPRYQPQQKPQQTLGVSQNRRYVYGGSVTPQPLRNSRSNIGRGPYEYDNYNAMIRGSSQSSMVSTNPFESDDDETDDLKTGIDSVMNGSTTTLTSRTPRKKRRAPAPPTPIHGRSTGGVSPPTIRIESSQDNTQDELHIKEDIDIANLTAEIESFVKTKSNDDVEEAVTEEMKTANDNENVKIAKIKEEKEAQQRSTESNVITNTAIIAEDIKTSRKEKTNTPAKANGQVTTETVTATTISNETENVIKPVDEKPELSPVSVEIETKIDESKEIKTNGAIPKKPTNKSVGGSSIEQQHSTTAAEELCIKETYAEEDQPQKPVPFKRHTKLEAEVGHMECIHLHVESPKASPRKEHPPNGFTSFKSTETIESTETITPKTPFVLTSPPNQRRNQQQTHSVEPVTKETVRILGKSTTNKFANELNIKEEVSPKPEISVKPTLSPKPITKELNGKVQGYADIHKPTRRIMQNGHVRKTSRDGSISPPFVPQHSAKNEEEKINNTDQFHNKNNNAEQPEVVRSAQSEKIANLKIVETTAPTKTNSDVQIVQDKNPQELSENNNVSTIVNHNEAENRDDEYEFLYRPKPASHMEWKRSTLAPLETHIPPEKRKSVKDIIESINRSQRLLNAAANKDFPALQNQNTTTTSNTGCSQATSATQQSSTVNNNDNNLNENLKLLNEKQEELQRLVQKMTPSADAEDQRATGAASSPSPSPSNDNNDNTEIFQKCKVNKEVFDYRETSPISSNLDWNPVPKPKRTKAAHE